MPTLQNSNLEPKSQRYPLTMILFLRYSLIADVAPYATDRTANFQYCVKITNLEQYSSYQLLAQVGERVGRTDPQTGASIYQIIANTCIPIHRVYDVAYITAIEKNHLNQNDLKIANSNQISIDPKIQIRLAKGTHLLHPRMASSENAGKLIQGSYEIKSIDRNGLKLIPVYESKQILNPLNPLIFPAIGITILGWIIWRRRSKKICKKSLL
jgi:hypothetical protein